MEIINELEKLRLQKVKNEKKEREVIKNSFLSCDLCKEEEELYMCPVHKKVFCYVCLQRTERINNHRSLMKARCVHPECSFFKLNKENNGRDFLQASGGAPSS